jgi:hypothetical protein
VRSQGEGYSGLKGRQGAADLGVMAVYPADDPLATTRNYIEFANQGGRYDEVARFLVSPEVRSRKD